MDQVRRTAADTANPFCADCSPMTYRPRGVDEEDTRSKLQVWRMTWSRAERVCLAVNFDEIHSSKLLFQFRARLALCHAWPKVWADTCSVAAQQTRSGTRVLTTECRLPWVCGRGDPPAPVCRHFRRHSSMLPVHTCRPRDQNVHSSGRAPSDTCLRAAVPRSLSRQKRAGPTLCAVTFSVRWHGEQCRTLCPSFCAHNRT